MHTLPHQRHSRMSIQIATRLTPIGSEPPDHLTVALALPPHFGGSPGELFKPSLQTKLALLPNANTSALKLEAAVGCLLVAVFVPLVRGDNAIEGLRKGAAVALRLDFYKGSEGNAPSMLLTAQLDRDYWRCALPGNIAITDFEAFQASAIADFVSRPHHNHSPSTDFTGLLPSFSEAMLLADLGRCKSLVRNRHENLPRTSRSLRGGSAEAIQQPTAASRRQRTARQFRAGTMPQRPTS